RDWSSDVCSSDLLPWSGQTAPPAGGAQHASVNLSVRRNNRFDDALVFREGVAVFEQRLNDWGPEGPVDVSTARRYVAAATVALAPGDPGPVVVPVVAERPGYGGNVPPPGTINRIVQVGSGMSNTDASVVPGDTSHELRAAAIPDVPVLEHVGQQVLFTEGA